MYKPSKTDGSVGFATFGQINEAAKEGREFGQIYCRIVSSGSVEPQHISWGDAPATRLTSRLSVLAYLANDGQGSQEPK